MKGQFITFEGGEGAGKSTLIISLHAALIEKGLNVLQTRAPGGTAPGKVIRELLLHPVDPVVSRAELFLYLADRAQHVARVIRPALEKGMCVLCDRYNDSTIAYQGGARGFGMDEIERFCQFATENLEPHLTIYLDIDPMIGLQRVMEATGRKDQIEAEDIVFHQKIRETYLALAKKYPKRIYLINGERPKQEVFEEALKVIDANCLATYS